MQQVFRALFDANKTSGFTLIELLVTIATIAILATGTLYALNPTKRIGDTNDGRRKADLISVGKAIELYTADNGTPPAQLASSGIAVNQKYVLCSSPATLTCAGQSNDCLVVTDSNFLGQYITSLPIDPSKTEVTDTGYYVTRSNTNSLVLGACSSYNTSAPVQVVSRVNLPTYVPSNVCGDGELGGSEKCDYDAGGPVCPNWGSHYYSGYVEDGINCIGKYGCSVYCDSCISYTACMEIW